MTPRYAGDGWELHVGDCLAVLPGLTGIDAVVTDPPYGISYRSGMTGHNGGTALPGIMGDSDTSLRDSVLDLLRGMPAIVFGTWKRAKPDGVKAVLTWDKGDHVGMGDLSLPWKPNTEEIYIIGGGFIGHRGTSVLRWPAPVTWNSTTFGREHPHQKPIGLMTALIEKCQSDWTILDPFAGSASTGVACIKTNRRFIGIEIDPHYAAIAAKRLERAEADKRNSLPFPEPEPRPVQSKMWEAV